MSEEALRQLDPDKIYVENVRSILNTSHRMAEEVCETATLRGLFKRHVEVLSPYTEGTIATAEHEEELPEYVPVWKDEGEGYVEETLRTIDLPKLTYYSLNDARAQAAGIA